MYISPIRSSHEKKIYVLNFIYTSVGINPYSLDGANIGVFTSIGMSERDVLNADSSMNNVLLILGNAKTMSANRLSYALNFTGRCLHIIRKMLLIVCSVAYATSAEIYTKK